MSDHQAVNEDERFYFKINIIVIVIAALLALKVDGTAVAFGISMKV